MKEGYAFHGQGAKNFPQPDGEMIERPSAPGMIVASAILWALDQHEEQPEKIIMSGYTFPGQQTALGQIDANELIRRGVPESDIIADDTARTTLEEVIFASEQAKLHGLQKMKHFTTNEKHAEEIRILAKRYYNPNIEVEVVTGEEVILGELPALPPFASDAQKERRSQVIQEQNRLRHAFRKYKKSKTANMLKLYEDIKLPVTKWGGETIFQRLAHADIRPDPTQNPIKTAMNVAKAVLSRKTTE